jgi:hypothetical protein
MLKVKRPLFTPTASDWHRSSLYDKLHSYKLWVQRVINAVFGGDCQPRGVIRALDIDERVSARNLRLYRHGDLERQWGLGVSGSMGEL